LLQELSGIVERRLWEPAPRERAGDRAGERAIEAAGSTAPGRVLVNTSVTRDYFEPSTPAPSTTGYRCPRSA
jgi:hypothetical protein